MNHHRPQQQQMAHQYPPPHPQHPHHQQHQQQHQQQQQQQQPTQSSSSALFRSLYYFIIYPFFLAIIESLALWRVVPFLRASPQLRKYVRNCIALNGVVFLGSLFFYTFVLGPILEFVLTWGNSHSTITWWGPGSEYSPELITPPSSSTHLWATTLALFEFIYHSSWTVPVWVVSMVANSFFHGKISEEVFRIRQQQLRIVLEQDNDNNNNNNNPHGGPAQQHHQLQHQQQQQPQPQQQQDGNENDQELLNDQIDDRDNAIAQQRGIEVAISPLRLFTIVTEQLSRILIFLFLLIQATVLSMIPDLVSAIVPAAQEKTTTAQYLTATVFTILKNMPLMISYGLTAISYTYAMFEFTWSSPNLLQLYKKTTFTKTQIAIMSQLQALRGEHDMSQLNCRFKYVEFRAAYFIGFSILITIATFHLSLLTSISLFGLLFPLNLLTSLVAHGHIDLLDQPLFPQQQQTQPSPNSSNTNATPKPVVIPPNTSPVDTLTIIYTAHDLTVPPQLPIFGIARWLNDHIFIFVTRWLQRISPNRGSQQ